MSIAVKVKHSKVVHDATVEPSDTGATFKERLYQITGASNLLLLLLLLLHAHLSRIASADRGRGSTHSSPPSHSHTTKASRRTAKRS